MTADQSICGKLADILKKYSSSSGIEQGKIFELMQKGVCIKKQEFFDGSSLWHRNARNRRLSIEPLAVNSSERLSDAAVNNLLTFLKNNYSLEQIKEYMNTLFGDKNCVKSAEIDILNDHEFIMLFLATIRAGERNTNFKAQVGSGNREINGYSIPELMYNRK
jgi:hypothetical protein